MELSRLFVSVFNMSITACWMVGAVAVCRCLLKRLPHLYSYLLWLVVFFRLVCPVSFTAGFSLMGLFGRGEQASRPVTAAVQGGASSMEWAAPPPEALQSTIGWLPIVAAVWVVVAVLLAGWGMVSMLRLRHRLRGATPIGRRLYCCEGITTPFAFGLWRPAVYLPTGLEEQEYSYIIRHEQTHIRRLDHLAKPLAYGIVCLHWFNPLCWLAYLLFCRDMEMSCDEQVLSRMGNGIKVQYSRSLLAMASHSQLPDLRIAGFGEHDAKRRIENVLNYKNPAMKKMTLALCGVAAATLILLANPVQPAVAAPVSQPQSAASSTPALLSQSSQPLQESQPEPSPESSSEPQAGSSLPATEDELDVAASETTPSEDTVPTVDVETDALTPEELAQLPTISFAWPVDGGYMSAGLYGYRGHTGMDIAAPAGTEVYAAQDGVVLVANAQTDGPYGKRIDIDHGSGWVTRYAHCSEVFVEAGQEVKQGDLIAKVGTTGNAYGNQCHFEVRYEEKIVDPSDYIGTKSPQQLEQEEASSQSEPYLFFRF